MQLPVIHQDPYRIAAGTWIIPQIVPTGPGVCASVNSMVITAAEPVIVDTLRRQPGALDRAGVLDRRVSPIQPVSTDVQASGPTLRLPKETRTVAAPSPYGRIEQ
jgi:hypothetical protein